MISVHAHEPLAVGRSIDPLDFHQLASFNDGSFSVVRVPEAQVSDWEFHADTDELLFVLAGSVTIEIGVSHGGSEDRRES